MQVLADATVATYASVISGIIGLVADRQIAPRIDDERAAGARTSELLGLRDAGPPNPTREDPP